MQQHVMDCCDAPPRWREAECLGLLMLQSVEASNRQVMLLQLLLEGHLWSQSVRVALTIASE